MVEHKIPSQQELEQLLFDDLYEYVSQTNKWTEQLIENGPILPEDVENLEWARDRISDSVDSIKYILDLFDKDIGNRGATSHVAMHLRQALIGAFSMGQIMHNMESARRLVDIERVKAAVEGKIAAKYKRAEQLRHLIVKAARRGKNDPRIKNPEKLLEEARKIIGFEKLDRKTLSSYIDIIDGKRKIDVPPD